MRVHNACARMWPSVRIAALRGGERVGRRKLIGSKLGGCVQDADVAPVVVVEEELDGLGVHEYDLRTR